ncbi:unnamed protein product [Clonostachys rosea f. rosea IK726]|uniref:Uncharacterized protein n=1 Tax=Clonostachys rosea f. rosea IK726 TaxID=1349383 RepID=A0ACA9UD63_BIOOC|nr:unnamed protein product [Clonostachys rosea f. rosea IK726]
MGSISAFDSIIFRNLFGTDEIRSIFSDQAYVKRCTGLARAQAHCNVIPAEAAKEITALSNTAGLDFDRLRSETDIVGYPILPLVRQLSAMCGSSGKFVHWGATTQDIMDTASVLQIKDGLAVVEGKLDSVISALERLSFGPSRYTNGRSDSSPARPPCYLWYKCAVWLSGLQRHKERLRQLVPRPLWFNTAVPPGPLRLWVQERMRDGPRRSPITWHVARDGIAEVTNLLALIGGTLGKVALDLIFIEVILAASKILRSNAGLVLDSMVADFERASGPWHLEWVAIPESFVMAVGALHQAEFVLAGLEVSKTQMAANLALSKGLIVGEAVMMSLANHMGRQNAHDVVYKACKETIELGGDVTLLQTLKKDQRVLDAITTEELESLCDPMNYMGSSQRMVDSILSLQNE